MQLKRFYLPDPADDLRWALEKLGEQDQLFVGIDPGVTGAIAFLPTYRKVDPFCVDMPILTTIVDTHRKGKKLKGKRNTFDYSMIAGLFDPLIDHRDKVIVALERAQPQFQDTPKTAFSVAMGYGLWQLYFTAFGLRYDEYQPAAWKRGMQLKGGEENKDQSRAKAIKLFPGSQRFLRCKGDHNRAEALLLAEYARRENCGEKQK